MKLKNYQNHVLVTIYHLNDLDDLTVLLQNGDLKITSIIIDLLKCDVSHEIIVEQLLPFHFIWQKTNKSFILVAKMIEKDSQELTFIKTLEEAIDYFYMDELTRNI